MIVKILGFLLGFFITIIIINYYSIEQLKTETFTIANENIRTSAPPVSGEQQTQQTQQSQQSQQKQPIIGTITTINTTINEDLISGKNLPYKDYKFMNINSYNGSNKIINGEGRWYETDLNIPINSLNDIYNSNQYFSYKNNISFISNDINKNGAIGANINGIQLNGPKSFYFANNLSTNELNEFSLIITGKFKNFENQDNYLFEMTGNTETSGTSEYKPSIININIMKNIINTNNFDIRITIGNNVYNGLINNIDRNNIINNDFVVIGLIYTSTDITLYLNKQKFTYTNTETFKTKLGSTPVIINKNGSINMDLYNFIYYKIKLPENEILRLSKYNYYYLSGIDFIVNNSNNTCKDDQTKLETRIKEIEANILKSLSEKQIPNINNEINDNKNSIRYQIVPLKLDKISNKNNNSTFIF